MCTAQKRSATVNGKTAAPDAALQPVAEGQTVGGRSQPSVPRGGGGAKSPPAGGDPPAAPATFESSFTHAGPTLEPGDGDAIRGRNSSPSAAAAAAGQRTSPFGGAVMAAAATGDQV